MTPASMVDYNEQVRVLLETIGVTPEKNQRFFSTLEYDHEKAILVAEMRSLIGVISNDELAKRFSGLYMRSIPDIINS